MSRDPELVDSIQAAAFLDVTKERFYNIGVQPVAKSGRKNLYCPRQLREKALELAQRRAPEPVVSKEKLAEARQRYEIDRARKVKAEADGLELVNALKKEQVAPFSFLSHVLATIAAQLSAGLDAIPVRLVRETGLKTADAEPIKEVLAAVGNEVSNLVDETWVAERLTEYREEYGDEWI